MASYQSALAAVVPMFLTVQERLRELPTLPEVGAVAERSCRSGPLRSRLIGRAVVLLLSLSST